MNVPDVVNQWLPLLTLAAGVGRLYYATRKRVTEWADTLLDNHFAHMQASLDRQTELLEQILKK